jgi:hypothetical protein
MGLLGFIIGVIISTIVIYFVTKIFGEREGIKTAFIAAIIGSVIFYVGHILIGSGIIAAAIAGIVWVFVLKWLYNMGWIKSIAVAVVIWIITTIIGAVLPTGVGPL